MVEKALRELVRQRAGFQLPDLIHHPVPRCINELHDLQDWLAEDIVRWIEYICRHMFYEPGDIQYIMGKFLTSDLTQDDLDVDGLRNVVFTEAQDNRMKKILGMRGISKSFTIQAFLGFRYVRVPHTRTMIISGTEQFAGDMGRSFLNLLKDLPALSHIAPTTKVAPTGFDLNDVWKEQQLSVRSHGVTSSMISSRADLFVFDDPETLDNTKDEEQKDDLYDRCEQAFNILHPPGRILERIAMMLGAPKPTSVPIVEQTQIVIAGTYQHEESMYIEPPAVTEEGTPIRYPWRGTSELRIPCWNENHESVFPQRLPTAELEFRESRMSVRNWRLHYELNPEPLDKQYEVIKMDKIVFVENPLITGGTVAYIDPAESGECEWGLCLAGINQTDNRPHIRALIGFQGDVGGPDAWIYKGNSPDLEVAGYIGGGAKSVAAHSKEQDENGVLNKIMKTLKNFGVTRVVIERNRPVPVALIKRAIKNRGLNIVVDTYWVKGDKTLRIPEILDPAVNSGIVTFHPSVFDADKEGQRNRRLMRELRYGFLPMPIDRLDALAGYIVENIPEVRQLSPSFNRSIGMLSGLRPV